MPDSPLRTLIAETQVKFTVNAFGLYAISVTASCGKSHGLKVKIDDQQFREVPPRKNIQTYDIPPAWNGNKLRGLKQTNVFLLILDEGEHIITFIPRDRVAVEAWDYRLVESPAKVSFSIENQAEDGDKRPWFTFVLVDLPLKSITAEADVAWHYLDVDDVKLIVDNKIERNPDSRLWRDWAWHAVPRQLLDGPRREQKTVTKNLASGLHYIEFWADKTPTLHQVTFDLGEFELKRIPSRNSPKWTEDFNDDTDVIILARLIFGEARNQSKEAMTGVGWVIKNRLRAKRSYFGYSYHEIILKNDHRYYQFSSFNPADPNYPVLIDPFNAADETTSKAWFEAYDVAESITADISKDPTEGATFFHSSDLSQEQFLIESVPGAIFTKRIGNILFYKDPNDA